MSNLLIIGGSDAGISAALRAREEDGTADVTVVVSDTYPNYSVCGIPLYVSGEVLDWHQLAHRTGEEITREGLRLLHQPTYLPLGPTGHQQGPIAGEDAPCGQTQ